jgi:hypothetical protein
VNLARKLWQRAQDMLPLTGFHFDRPLVLLQSDDWGRVGLRDQEGFEQLRSEGLTLGERPYDFYTLETAEDLAELRKLLKSHRDSAGQHPSILMNFIVANLDFAKIADGENPISLVPLADGFPQGWTRPELVDGYHAGIADGIFRAALHGTTHFCRAALERARPGAGERLDLLHKLWRAGTPYIHWRMPWIGYEYWDPEKSEDERFLASGEQRNLIGQAVGMFAKLFSTLPRSACAPGYRANDDTHRAWAEHGIRVAQNGPGALVPPYLGRYEILQLTRTVEFEPATEPTFSVEDCVRQADDCFALGIPAILSVHSINFHSTVKDFRSRTLRALNEFLAALESKHADLLYLDGEHLRELVNGGGYQTSNGRAEVTVTRKKFLKSKAAQRKS